MSLALLRDIDENYEASLRVSPTSPTRFTPTLEAAVFASQKQFYAGQFVDANATTGFIATTGVLICVVVFAWVQGEEGTMAFGAHIPRSSILNSARRLLSGAAEHPLDELTRALLDTFQHIAADRVKLHIVGGHVATDQNEYLQSWFPNDYEKQFLSWHILTAVKVAGFTDVNTTMLNRFPGGDLSTIIQEQRIRDSNQRFCCAALHLETGKVVTHSEEASQNVPLAWWREDSKALSSIVQPWGQPLFHVNEFPGLNVATWQILIVVAMLWGLDGCPQRLFIGAASLWYFASYYSRWVFWAAAAILLAACSIK